VLLILSMFAFLPAVMVVAIVVVVPPIVTTLHVDLAVRLAHEAAADRWRGDCDPENGTHQTAQFVSHGGASGLGRCIRRARVAGPVPPQTFVRHW
jgi:hypothetical protein